jgi:hypothetical protein
MLLLAPGSGAEQEVMKRPWGKRAKVAVADWDADGRADLLVGDYFAVKIPAPVLKEDEEEAFAQRKKAYDDAMKKYQQALAESGLLNLHQERRRLEQVNDPESQQELEEVDRKLVATLAKLQPLVDELQELHKQAPVARHEAHGHVWLFRRLPDGGQKPGSQR